jgi:sulfide:quinone oxidoreductase
VVAAAIVARHRGTSTTHGYDGRGTCYLEFGGNQVGRVTVSFLAGTPPRGELEGPSVAIAMEKAHFGASRVQRWFGREWSPAAASHPAQ